MTATLAVVPAWMDKAARHLRSGFYSRLEVYQLTSCVWAIRAVYGVSCLGEKISIPRDGSRRPMPAVTEPLAKYESREKAQARVRMISSLADQAGM